MAGVDIGVEAADALAGTFKRALDDGAGVVSLDQAHLVLAVLSIEEQLVAAGLSFEDRIAAYNTAGKLLTSAGVSLDASLVQPPYVGTLQISSADLPHR
ncbi:hypothetical protein Rhe02_19560 [Rhizocola hellebori]|uniref:Uncharacterized protein n=1 Tax=Rhizocola hellebori TaxID=1392758 RepID=A0A8J3Q5P9_9ACTN|nr:hypothetical protein [Rhizocola hellebori]GIH03889.1 hypothetical protein Rhe02_19560 [Rhizocola hellebori]